MDIFVRNLPDQMTENDVNRLFKQYLNNVGITTWKCDKLKSKGCAIITIADVTKARRFLQLHGPYQHNPTKKGQARQPIWHMNRSIGCSPSNKPHDAFVVKSLEKEEKDKKTKAIVPGSALLKKDTQGVSRSFAINQIRCGQWDYHGSDLLFKDYYHSDLAGQINFGPGGLFITTFGPKFHLEISYRSIDSYTTGSSNDPSLTFSLREPPKIFQLIDTNTQITTGSELLDAMNKLLLQEGKGSQIRRKRVIGFDQTHETVVGACLCYRFQLKDPEDLPLVQSLKRFPEVPSSICFPTPVVIGPLFSTQMQLLSHTLAAYQKVPFDLKFQLQRLAQNGSLAPYKVSELLVAISGQITPDNDKAYVDAVYQLYSQIPFAGPNTEASAFSLSSLVKRINQNCDRIDKGQSFRENWEHYDHLILVHKATITPAGIYLSGPQPEVKNRVLRKYALYPNHFLSVSFSEEDGEAIRHDRNTSNEDIFQNRFRSVLEGALNVAGRAYKFLGFSHSSLRAHTCWFMAPFVIDGTLNLAPTVIQNLGDFTRIRSPAKCAARIGQAFSQTMSSIHLPPEAIHTTPDITRNGRTFSDGVGTCSRDVLHKIWDQHSTARGSKPTVIQVRIQGAKGILSLDTSLQGLTVRLRPSMIKFEGTNVSDIEICGSGLKPLPMMLNRQLIKILEDLGVGAQSFLALQATAVDELRATTKSSESAAKFLRDNYVGAAAKLPWLVRKLWEIGVSFSDDAFLRNTIELTVLARLRELKYRARIPVSKGVTLYGIMDETGILEEGQIYCSFDSSVILGSVVITRCPALHPGDVRVVTAVEAPSESRLRDLHNVVVFSQNGDRDLPSMLSGGDLDGDLYNVIYDSTLHPERTYDPADYTIPQPIDIGRPVEARDMSDHFLSFMENDALGRIAILHQIIADMSGDGVLDGLCLHLAGLHSDAVDFSKTGIPVPFEAIPRYPNARPDFLANGPRVVIEEKSVALQNDRIIDFFEDVTSADPLAEAASYAAPKIRYYESQKVLGKLYRNIDEYLFLEQLQKQAQSSSLANQDVIGSVWNYVRTRCTLIQWEHLLDEAKDIKGSYEDNLIDTMIYYSTSPNEFLSEAEVFSGNILGKYGSASKRQRESSAEMKTKFDQDVAYTVECIKNGSTSEGQESFARSIACLYVSMTTQNSRQKVGALTSFQWIAASTCLKEVEDMLSAKQ